MSSAEHDSHLRYKEKVTIVTGGSRGLGQACVELFARHGSKVVFCAILEELGLELQSKLNHDFVGEAKFVKCDVTKEDDVKNLIETTVELYGRIDCLINNAGIAYPVENLETLSADMFRKIYEVNVIAPFQVSKFAIPYLRKTKGNIINICSIVGVIGQDDSIAYVSSKAALIGLTKAMAVDESKYGVRVNGLSPGPVRTTLLEQIASASQDPEKYLKIRETQVVMNRLGKPEEIAMACLYLAADATYSTGVNLLASGGCELSYGIKTAIEQFI